MDHSKLSVALYRLMGEAVQAHADVPGVCLVVSLPSTQFYFADAIGLADRDSGEALTARHPCRLASNTKTYVAAGILRLWEKRELKLDRSIRRYLHPLSGLALKQGGYETEAITIRHLLTHTSGIYDFCSTQTYVREAKNAAKVWTRLEQLQLAMAEGQPYGKPGAVYRYSDTGYNLLADIVERRLEKHWTAPLRYRTQIPSYGAILRDLLGFDRLGIAQTWLETAETPPAGLPPLAHQYRRGADMTLYHPSADLFGGGGLVATIPDLCRFYEALFAGEVFKKRETLEEMLTTVPAERGGDEAYGMEQIPGQYRLGILATDVGGQQAYHHGGYGGTEAAYFPSLGATVALTVNAAETDVERDLLAAVAGKLAETL